MKLKPEQLSQHLKSSASSGLLPLYFISGDETLLSMESCDSIRSCARQLGYTERELFHLDTANASWSDIIQETNSLSLFSDRKIIEIRCKSNKLGKEGSEAIQEILAAPNPDNVIIITVPKLESAQNKSKWLKLIEKEGCHIQVWPIDRKQLPNWIAQRLQQHQLHADNDAINFLADSVEGNLLAAKQEIQKLALLLDDEQRSTAINIDTMTNMVSSSSRYTVFNLCDKVLAGDLAASIRTLNGLKNEGTEATLVLWSLSKEIRTLLKISLASSKGTPVDQAMRSERVFQNRQRLVQTALQRIPAGKLNMMLRKARHIDQSIKGIKADSPWLLLEQLCIQFCKN